MMTTTFGVPFGDGDEDGSDRPLDGAVVAVRNGQVS